MEKEKENTGKRKRAIIIVIVIIVVAVFGLAAYRAISDKLEKPAATAEEAINIRVATAEMTNLNTTSVLTGKLEAENEVAVVPMMAGEVTQVNVQLGDHVLAGAVLFRIDDRQAGISENQAGIGLNQAQIGLKQAEISLNDAKTNLDRMENLYNEGAISLQVLEQSRSAYALANEGYNAAKQATAAASEAAAAASLAASYNTVTAPIDGYITAVNVLEGSIASQAAPAVVISDTDKLKISTSLSENMINKVHLGDKVNVMVKAISDEPFIGTVTTLLPSPAMGTLTYPMEVTLDNADASIKAGMFAEIILVSDRVDNVVAIPSKAVFIKLGEQMVVTVGADNAVKFNKVVTGLDSGEMVEIKSGIKAGDTVVTDGQSYLQETSKVNIIS